MGSAWVLNRTWQDQWKQFFLAAWACKGAAEPQDSSRLDCRTPCSIIPPLGRVSAQALCPVNPKVGMLPGLAPSREESLGTGARASRGLLGLVPPSGALQVSLEPPGPAAPSEYLQSCARHRDQERVGDLAQGIHSTGHGRLEGTPAGVSTDTDLNHSSVA